MNYVINSRFCTQSMTGVQRYAYELSLRLAKMGGASSASPGNILEHTYTDLNPTRIGHLEGHAWEQIELPAHLWLTGSPLLVNLANTAPLAYGKQIVTIHDLAFIRNPHWFSKTFAAYYNFLIPIIARRSMSIITVSEFSKKEIVDLLGIPPSKIHVIYNGVSEIFKSDVYGNDEKRFGKYILAVSSFDPRKNLRGLIEAFLKLKYTDLKLVIAGRASKNFNMDEAFSEPGANRERIIFLSDISQNELASLYRGAIALCYPSFYEGFGLPPLEAMASGCPVVASDIESIREVCRDAAILINPNDTGAMTEGLRKLIEDETLRLSLIERGKKRSCLFNWERSADKIFELIQEIGRDC